MNRIYEELIYSNLQKYSQMAFLVGPRQVGKTTIAKHIQSRFADSLYLNFDALEDRRLILSGQSFIEEIFPTNVLRENLPLVIFDEIHKYKDWKNYIKGFYDLYHEYYKIIVTGSARLDIYNSGGDSLMGRYFQYNIHPLSIGELLAPQDHDFLRSQKPVADKIFTDLFKYGGFPDPYNKAESQYSNLWQSTRLKQLIHEEIRSITIVQEIYSLEVLAEILKSRAGQLLNSSNLANQIKVTTQTVSRWIGILERFYYCFTVCPWFKNVTRSLIKEPKIYLWDWSQVQDEGARIENFLASHLFKFVNFYSDTGFGRFKLFYLRNLDKREVDFLIVRDDKPFMIIESKKSDIKLSRAIPYFANQINPQFAFQVVFEASFINKNCFTGSQPLIVPARTFLSQLI